MLLKHSGGFEARDPWILFHDGKFYHCFTKGAERLCVTCADTPEALIDANEVCVWIPEAGQPWSCELWAPELHVIDGVCYIYVACDDGDNYHHRMYVLTNDSADPQKPYRMLGKASDASDKWAIDATVLHHPSGMYMIWSGWHGDENVCQKLYIAKMSDPCTVSSHRVMISAPEYDWEKMDCDGISLPFINEGPCVYQSNGKTYLFYSASGSWANHYCIGLLELLGDDPMDPVCWRKQPFPALSMEDGWNGPGHCSVTTDGTHDYIAFHTYDAGETRGWDRVHAVISRFCLEDGKLVLLK